MYITRFYFCCFGSVKKSSCTMKQDFTLSVFLLIIYFIISFYKTLENVKMT